MPSKSILKKTVEVKDTALVDDTNVVLDDDNGVLMVPDHYALPEASPDIVSIEQDGGGIPGNKKTQIKKKESIDAGSGASKPTLKIIKKKVSITVQPEESIMKESIMKDEKLLPKEKEIEKEIEKATEKAAEKDKEKDTEKIKREDRKEEKDREVLVDVSKALKASKKPSKKQDITEIFNDDDVDYRYIITNYDFSKNKTLPKITKYEKALIVGKRAKQIEEGANPNVKVLPGQTSIDIAEEELRQRKIPFIIKRPIGNKFEYWKPIDMEVIMD
jgi:DNA-directed RNA polymerase subunit K/omega